MTVAMAIISGFAITPRSPVYTATASLYVGSRSIDIAPGSGDIGADRAAGLSFLANSFATIIETRLTAERALDYDRSIPLTVEQAEDAITAVAQPASLLVTVDVSYDDPGVAKSLADAVVDSFVTLMQDQEANLTLPSDAETPAPVSVFEHASVPTDPQPSSLPRNLVLATMFGFLIAVGFVVLLEYLDLTIKSADDAQHRLQLPVLGAIPIDTRLVRG